MRDAHDEFLWQKFGTLAAVILNCHRKKGTRAFTMEDFNPYVKRKEKVLNTDKDVAAFFRGRDAAAATMPLAKDGSRSPRCGSFCLSGNAANGCG